MHKPILVKIIGAPVACKDGVKDTWREVAEWAGEQLRSRYGESVRVQYYDLFDPDCPTLPPDSRLPVVFVNDLWLSSGGKISIPLIRKKIEELGVPL
jgi:disulfide oxidoreductase YuzD